MKAYMRDYRNGIRRKQKNDEVREQIKQDRLNGDNIYIIGLRYGYRPESVARLCQNLPIKKHANRHKLFYATRNK